ncbi:hypothetical protein SDC9_212114 [bioreactor metagenome]|uniref:Uncharacterized protein n=1 Tax=bioreactor metagenome TaxID=1076179 RepID=A0A645JM24_9ZZZZ
MRRVLQHGHAFVGAVEKDDGGTQNLAVADEIDVHNVRDAHHDKNQHLLADALEADLAGQLFVRDGAHDTGDVVHNYEHKQRI